MSDELRRITPEECLEAYRESGLGFEPSLFLSRGFYPEDCGCGLGAYALSKIGDAGAVDEIVCLSGDDAPANLGAAAGLDPDYASGFSNGFTMYSPTTSKPLAGRYGLGKADGIAARAYVEARLPRANP